MALLVWNVVVYSVSLILLGVMVPKAVAITAMATVSAAVGYFTKWIYRFGFFIMILATLVAVNLLPPITTWASLVRRLAG